MDLKALQYFQEAHTKEKSVEATLDAALAQNVIFKAELDFSNEQIKKFQRLQNWRKVWKLRLHKLMFIFYHALPLLLYAVIVRILTRIH